jgi:hypothetical protein
MRHLIFLLSISACSSSFGQITNSSSADKSGMIFYAVDSVIRIVKTMQVVDRIVLRTNSADISEFPEVIDGVSILKQQGINDFSVKGITRNNIVFRIMRLSINQDQVTLPIGTYQKVGKHLRFFGDVIYVFCYIYLPDSQTYKLAKVKKGTVL